MKKLKIAGVSVVALLVVLTAVGFLLPSHATLRRSVEVKAPMAAVFPLLNNLKAGFSSWNPFVSPDDKTYHVSYSGPDDGVGATQSWDGKTTGEGTMKILRADPTRGVDYEVVLMHGSYRLGSSFSCEPKGQTTVVTWTCEMDYGNNPVNRYFGALLAEDGLGKEMQKGLETLGKRAESATVATATPPAPAAASGTP
jgi:polyketide cyclase/dehydrase/lipid transport protein